MTEPRFPAGGMPDRDLSGALIDLGRQIAYPATPDIARRGP